MISRDVFQTIQDSYKKWDIPSHFFKEDKVTTPEDFLKILKIIEGRIPEMNCRIMPTFFNANNPHMLGFPYHLTPYWPSCERALRSFAAHGVMVRLPLFWQIEANIHNACRVVNAFLFLNEQENIPIGITALKYAMIDSIVTDIDDSHIFLKHLLKKEVFTTLNWVIIHFSGQIQKNIPEYLMSKEVKVAQEVHLFPGVPVLEQCKSLRASKKSSFHILDSYIIEEQGDHVVITSNIKDDPLPFLRYQLPFSLEKIGQCDCSRVIFSMKT